jgi:hypothetical protein
VRKRIPSQKKNRRIGEFFKDFDREKRDAGYRARPAAGSHAPKGALNHA